MVMIAVSVVLAPSATEGTIVVTTTTDGGAMPHQQHCMLILKIENGNLILKKFFNHSVTKVGTYVFLFIYYIFPAKNVDVM